MFLTRLSVSLSVRQSISPFFVTTIPSSESTQQNFVKLAIKDILCGCAYLQEIF